MKQAVLIALLLLGAAPAGAQIYRCTAGGQTVFTDEPCEGAQRVQVNPSQGFDSWSGQRRKGTQARREELNWQIDHITRPLHGMSHQEMNVRRRRAQNHLSLAEHAECQALDGSLARLEQREHAARQTPQDPSLLGRVQAELYQQRKRYRALKC